MTTTMMDWEETSPSSGGSLNGHSGGSGTEEETIIGVRTSNHVTTLNLKINCSYTTNSNISDKKSYFPGTKENSLLLNDGFNGLNLNPSPPAAGQNLSTSNFHHSLTLTNKSSSNSSSSSALPLTKGQNSSGSGVVGTSSLHSPSSSTSGGLTTSSSSGKKNKPIPPPLDLSIGASSLNSSSSSSSSSTGSGTFQYPGTFYSPFYHLGSPKFNQAEKSLPLRKRWHSWSPKLMQSNEDLIPLYADPHLTNPLKEIASGNGGRGSDPNETQGSGHSNSNGGNKASNMLQPPSYSMHSGRGNGNVTPQSAGLQTPTPFYTPNEPSPRFMNSPVFSYSTPDTTLYQGPYSPIRTSTLYPPGSPFLGSSLNTPTFVINVSPPSTSTSSSTQQMNSTIKMEPSSPGSSASSSNCTISGNHHSPQSYHLDHNQHMQDMFPIRMDTDIIRTSNPHHYSETPPPPDEKKYQPPHTFPPLRWPREPFDPMAFRPHAEPILPILNSLNGTGTVSAKKSKSKAKAKRNKESNNNVVSNSAGNSQEAKGRRPMNAFLVYAKEQRPLLIQKFPGKDNRSISTILGDSWKNLDPDKKNYYITIAKESADEQKRIHPDCWKRKRSSQQSQSNGPPMKMEVLTKPNGCFDKISCQ